MPIVLAFSDDRYLTIDIKSAVHMPPDAPTRNDEGQLVEQRPKSTTSVFIILSATAYSSVGFGLSLLALWVGWALPSGLLVTPPRVAESKDIRIRKGHRRTRSVGSKQRHRSSSPKFSRRSSVPVALPPTPIFGALDSNPHRHVSFVDSHYAPIRRNSAPTQNENDDENVLESVPLNSQLFSVNPGSSSTLVNPFPTPPPEEPIVLPTEPEPSSRPSTAPSCLERPPSSPMFRKLRLSFSKRKRTTQCENMPETPTTPTMGKEAPVEAPIPCVKRSHTFTPPWSHSKKSTPSDPLACFETASTRSSCSFGKSSSTSSSNSASSFSLPSKKSRRTSTPIPRTMPYEAPYFATPPLLLEDSYSAYLRRLPQFEDDMGILPVPPAEPSDLSNRGRNPKASDPALPRSSQRPVPKRRSASEDWSPRQAVSTTP